ncbi:MAG: thioredoxin-related protein [Granulosicoccus sp.]|jgi:thioredoxin-related protein
MRIQSLILLLMLLIVGNATTLTTAQAATDTLTASATIGDDGLHKQDWFSLTFKDVAEDLVDASAEDKRLVILFEQPGCIYCKKMHETVLADPEVVAYIKEHYTVVQYNLFGDEEVVDLDGEVLTEKTAAAKWNIMFTPTWLFLPTEAAESTNVASAAVGTMPGAFGKGTFLDLFTWVFDKGYQGEEGFQRYHARQIKKRRAINKRDGGN